MKKIKLCSFLICCALSATNLFAQYETSTASSPKWYYVKPISTDQVIEVAGDGSLSTQTKLEGLTGAALQLWRVEATTTSTTGNLLIVNKATGKFLNLAATGSTYYAYAGTDSTLWKLVKSGNNYSIAPQVSISGAGYMTYSPADNNLFFGSRDANYSWFTFVAFDSPLVSTDTEVAWLAVRSAKTDLANKCITDVSSSATGVAQFALQDYVAGDLTQQWKIVSKGSGNLIDFVNRGTGNIIGTTTAFDIHFYLQHATDATASAGWTITSIGSDQYQVRTGTSTAYSYWCAITEGDAPVDYLDTSTGSAFDWKFQLVDEVITGLKPITIADDVFAYAQDRRIVVKGTDLYRIYNIYGMQMPVNRELPIGMYIVAAQGKTVKVLVK